MKQNLSATGFHPFVDDKRDRDSHLQFWKDGCKSVYFLDLSCNLFCKFVSHSAQECETCFVLFPEEHTDLNKGCSGPQIGPFITAHFQTALCCLGTVCQPKFQGVLFSFPGRKICGIVGIIGGKLLLLHSFILPSFETTLVTSFIWCPIQSQLLSLLKHVLRRKAIRRLMHIKMLETNSNTAKTKALWPKNVNLTELSFIKKTKTIF